MIFDFHPLLGAFWGLFLISSRLLKQILVKGVVDFILRRFLFTNGYYLGDRVVTS